jgi:uncharacterized membrane protein YkvA (DUF1232 family)
MVAPRSANSVLHTPAHSEVWGGAARPAARGPQALAARRSRRLGGLGDPPVHILIACMPKSGSTFLTNVIAELPGFRRAELTPVYGRREQELDEFCLQQVDRSDFVAQNHVRNSEWTAMMCRDYGLTPVVLVRSLLDVIVSLRDHIRKESHVWPIFFAGARHAQMDDAGLELMIARLALPWYMNFYMGWREAPDALVIAYEDLAEAPAPVIAKVMAFCGAPAAPEAIEAAIVRVRADGPNRFNVGQAGRGRSLRPDAVRAVLEMLDFYPEAAGDPYIRNVRAECDAVLTGAAAPPRRAAVSAPPEPTPRLARWWRRKAQRLVMRRLVPAALVGLGVFYWLWPNDLVPDSTRFGRLDDVACLLATAIIAGRLTKYAPRGPNRRRPPATS